MNKQKKTMFELNEEYKDYPTRTNTYTMDRKTYKVTSHFIGTKDLDEVLYKIAVKRAFEEVIGTPLIGDVEYPTKKPYD